MKRRHAGDRTPLLFAIENIEPELSERLFVGYSHAVEIAGREGMVITKRKKLGGRRGLSECAGGDPKRAGTFSTVPIEIDIVSLFCPGGHISSSKCP